MCKRFDVIQFKWGEVYRRILFAFWRFHRMARRGWSAKDCMSNWDAYPTAFTKDGVSQKVGYVKLACVFMFDRHRCRLLPGEADAIRAAFPSVSEGLTLDKARKMCNCYCGRACLCNHDGKPLQQYYLHGTLRRIISPNNRSLFMSIQN